MAHVNIEKLKNVICSEQLENAIQDLYDDGVKISDIKKTADFMIDYSDRSMRVVDKIFNFLKIGGSLTDVSKNIYAIKIKSSDHYALKVKYEKHEQHVCTIFFYAKSEEEVLERLCDVKTKSKTKCITNPEKVLTKQTMNLLFRARHVASHSFGNLRNEECIKKLTKPVVDNITIILGELLKSYPKTISELEDFLNGVKRHNYNSYGGHLGASSYEHPSSYGHPGVAGGIKKCFVDFMNLKKQVNFSDICVVHASNAVMMSDMMKS